jgi:RNA polymerase sigma-70 factor (ECF subfamily)
MENVYVLGIDTGLEAEARVERLVLEHQVKLARYVARLVGERETALDVVQEVFLSAYRVLSADPARPLTAGWLYKTATNRALSHLRRDQRRGTTSLLESLPAQPCGAGEAAAHLDLSAALAALTPEQSACVLLTAYAGYSSGEAALMLGISPDAVRQRVCRALRVMRPLLVEEA